MLVKVLTGHTSPETAYRVEEYPYGFRLKCSIRYWLEHSPSKGFRLCSQTTNPKKPFESWNAPKKSTYTFLAVMGLDEQGRVTWTGVSVYDVSRFEAFAHEHGAHFGPEQRAVYDGWVAMRDRVAKFGGK